MGYLVGDGDPTIDVNEAIRITMIDLIDDMILLNPLWVDLSQAFFVFGVALR